VTGRPGLPSGAVDFAGRLEGWRDRVEERLEVWLPPADRKPERLHAAQRYAVLGPGKRIRPALVYATAETLGVPLEQVDAAACAVELIHAYSLVHDDLPAMDDDDLRRGRPTCHRAFDEATAILAGDSLQVLAFRLLAEPADGPPAARLRQIERLAVASGTEGMAGGQAIDLEAEGKRLGLTEIEQMHALKTGALIQASVLLAACCATGLASAQYDELARVGAETGLAFQIQDDILDVEGDPELLGKATGHDEARGKPTYPAVAGLDAAKRRVMELHSAASARLDRLGLRPSALADLLDWLLARRH
jgi:geranylgeranyl pyrophosphate synthase